MSKVGQSERATQNRVVRLFQKTLNYQYLGNWQDRPNNSNVELSQLRAYLQGKYRPILVNKAIDKFQKEVENQSKNLYDVNKAVYSSLRYGIKVKAGIGQSNETVALIDWVNPYNNHFAIAEEVTVDGQHDKRPDIVLYVNGIALGVIELKKSRTGVSEGIRQNLDNQKKTFIQHFFTTIQLVMAGNDTQGLRYGVIGTKEKYYLAWKEPTKDPKGKQADYTYLRDPSMVRQYEATDELLDQHIIQVCDKKRLLEIIYQFIVFDRGIKKACRPNQYFGVKAAQAFIRKRQGGIIWHTQGSGKSLTMVWLTKWIKDNTPDARILVVTDRDELDKQIEKVYKGVGEEIYRTRSGRDLIRCLNEKRPILMCSLIHKFGKKKKSEKAVYEEFIKDIKQDLPSNFKAKGDLYVFVDECHRTQSGKLHKAMKELMPHSLIIGFTGTPLLKKDKQKSIEVFGPYIHTYKFDEAVDDKVILDLMYEARDIKQYIRSPKKIDQWFEAKTRGIKTEYAKAKLKKRWGTMQKVLSSQPRLKQIVNDIILDMNTKDLLQNGRGNALLVSGSIYQACKYYELFQQNGFTKCAIITSYKPNISDIKGESTGEDAPTEKIQQYEIYMEMLNGKSVEVFEEEVKKKFIDEPAQMKLLIVVDKLLTGFDAPSATYLYIDKTMHDHGLFQAICRVNRLAEEDKEYGYIVDYKDLFEDLEKSVYDYTSNAFDNFDPEDVKGLLKNRLEKGKERLLNALEDIELLCEPVAQPKETQQYIRFFCGNPTNLEDVENTKKQRHELYKYATALIRAYLNMANDMENLFDSQQKRTEIYEKVAHYKKVREEIKIASGDYIDLKKYEPDMRYLLDTYIKAEETETISELEDLTLLDVIVKSGIGELTKRLPKGIRNNEQAVAETIENNIRSVIIEEQATNPRYYENMSKLLDDLVKQRNEQAIAYKAYMEKMVELAQMMKRPESSGEYPTTINTSSKRALYDALNKDEALALSIDEAIRTTKKDNWRATTVKKKQVKIAIKKLLPDTDMLEDIFTLVQNQTDY